MRTSTVGRNRDAGLLRLYAWAMIVCAGLAVAAALYTSRTVPQYAATAEILVEPTITPSGNYIQPSMPTEQRVAVSTEVIGLASARLDLSPKTLLTHLAVTVPVDTQVLVVTYTDRTPAAAWAGTNAVVETYLKSRNAADGKNAVASLVGPPEVPSAPVGTNYPVIVGAALMGGLLAGFGLAWTWDRVRGRIRTIADAERCADLDALAVVAPGRAGRAQAISLAARFRALAEGGPRPSLLVTGVGGGEGSTNVAAECASALSKMGLPVVLVTADVKVAAGLSGLHVVSVDGWDGGGTPGQMPEMPVGLSAAWVVIDGPPAWQCAGLSFLVDHILLVATPGRSSRTSAMAAVQALDHCSAKVMGLVIAPRARWFRRVAREVRAWFADDAGPARPRVSSLGQGEPSGVLVDMSRAVLGPVLPHVGAAAPLFLQPSRVHSLDPPTGPTRIPADRLTKAGS